MDRKVCIDRQLVVDTFCSLVRVPSPLLRVSAIMQWLVTWLVRHGIPLQFDRAGGTLAGFEIGNLISDVIPGTPGCEEWPIKAVEAHVDTVPLPPDLAAVNVVVTDDVIRSDGKSILGADDKAGVAAILGALGHILEHRLPHGPLQLLFTVGEERSMYGVRELDLGLVEAASVVCVDGLEGDILWRGGPAKLKYEATFHGHAGHAAMPGDTLHAGLVANVALMGAMNVGLLGTDPDWGILPGKSLESTIFHNVSRICTLPDAAFPSTNVVPGQAVIAGEFRSFSKQKMETAWTTLQRLFTTATERYRSRNGRHTARVEFQTEYPYEPYVMPEDHPLVKDALHAMEQAGIVALAELSPGATHANVFNQRGIPAVVLGAGGRNPHQTDEYVIIHEMVKAAETLVHYLTAT